MLKQRIPQIFTLILEMLDLDHSPMVYQLQLKGLKLNADGLYSFEDVNGRFEKAIAAYDDIK